MHLSNLYNSKPLSLVAILTFLLCIITSAQAQEAKPTSVREASIAFATANQQQAVLLLGEVITAMGGENAYRSSSNARIEGTRTLVSETPELNLKEKWSFSRNSKGYCRMTRDVQGHVQSMGYDGKEGWILLSTGKVLKLSALELRALEVELNQQSILLDYKEKSYLLRRLALSDLPASKADVLEFRHKDQAASFMVKGKEGIGFQPIDDQSLREQDVKSSAAGSVFRFHIDKSTKLVTKVEVLSTDRWTKANYWLVAQFSDYREVQNYQFPHKVSTFRDLKKISESQVTGVSLGVILDGSEFGVPK